jgi:acetyl esterase/lipase
VISLVATIVLVGTTVALCLWPPRPRHSSPWNLTFFVTYLVNEQPSLGLLWLASGTAGVLAARARSSGLDAGWWIAALATLTVAAGLALVAWRARTAAPALAAALREGLRDSAFVVPRSPVPWLRIAVMPFIAWRPDVRRVGNVPYGAHRLQRLDVYVARRTPAAAPVFVYLHGGGFQLGGKLLGAHPLLHLLASRGWIAITANYRLQPHVTYDDQVDDVRRVLAWVRDHARDFGADPSTVVVAGGSAGANLAAVVAPATVDGEPPLPRVAGLVGLYGYYGRAARGRPSPLDALSAGAPPTFIVHGGHDTSVIPPDARMFAARLRDVSPRPVVYAELPFAQHNFDFFHSLRSHAVGDAVLAFAEWTRRH